MGILQKDRHGTRALKPPIPVPDVWTERIRADQDTDDEAASIAETQLMGRLRSQSVDLATRVDLPWLEQSRLLKEAAASLGELQRLSEVSSATLGYLRQVAIPMFVECFFLPSDVVVRRQVIPVIKSLSALDPSCVDNVLQANLLAFIGAQDQHRELESFHSADARIASEFYERQSVSQRAQALEVLAGIPQGFPVIRRFVSDVLAYAASALDATLRQLRDVSKAAGSVELAAQRDDCTQILRLAFLCLSKLLADDSDLQAAILASMRAPAPGRVERTLARVYALSWEVVGCNGAALNARQVAAMVLVLLIEGSGLPRHDRAVALAVRALDIDVQNVKVGSVSYLPQIDDSRGRAQSMDDPVSMICIARAMVSLAAYETTLEPVAMEPSARLPSVCNNVHEAAFTHIASVCGRSQLAPAVKIVVFEAMAVWLQETAKLLARCLQTIDSRDAATRAFNDMAFALGERVLILQRERIMGYLWSYWDDPIDAVQAKVRGIFEAFLDIGSCMNRAIVADPSVAECALNSSRDTPSQPSQRTAASTRDRNAFLRDVLDLVLTMDWSRKVKYSLLAALCPRIDVLELLREPPGVLASCLATMAQVTMASRAALLLTAVLSQAADDIGKARMGGSGDQGETAALELETEHIALWTPPVVEALCRDDDTSRRMLAQHLLPALFECLPRIVGGILKALPAYRRPESDATTQSLDACRQHALIVVLKVARAQDIITIDRVVAMDTQLPAAGSLSMLDMLNQAVFHPDLSVRGDMLGLLCESRKLATPLSDTEYDLLFKLLRVSASAPSADFRQQQFGALTTLAARLVTVATHADRIVTTGRPPVPSQKIRHRERARREEAVARGRAEGKSEAQVLSELGVLPQDEMVRQAKAALQGVEWAVGKWLDLAVRGCLYPGAGFAKVAMGLRWLDILTAFFTPGRPAQAPDSAMAPFVVSALGSPDFRSNSSSTRHGAGVTAEEIVTVLTQVLIDDPFDANRASAFALLTSWPLVSADDNDAAVAAREWASQLLRRALHLVSSTRAGESESGALIIRWLFRKFVVLQGMRLDTGDRSRDVPGDLGFAAGLLSRIVQCRQAAERNLLDAAQHFPLHGLLTAAQYVVAEIDYQSSDVQTHAVQWQQWLQALAQAAIDICSVVLGVLTSASPEGNIPASFREMETKIDDIIRSAEEMNIGDSVDGADDGDDEDLLGGESGLGGSAGPRQQVILSYCWRAVKEVSGVLAAVATCPPGSDQGSLDSGVTPLLEPALLRQIGELLHTLLTSIRHRGAFSAVHPAFTDVCGRMFRSPAAELNQRVSQWLEQCLDTATICRVSVTRRSAGWPLCLLATLTCDKLAMQALLPCAMNRIFALAADLQLADGGEPATDELGDGTTDLPQVHAINMLRALLDDHTLASDVVPYVEQAFVLALTGLRSRRWAIRNVCGLLYAALTRRVFGNSRAREETKYDGITGRELFTRFPGLHPFLTNQLEDAVDRMAEIDTMQETQQLAAGDGGVIEVTDDEGDAGQRVSNSPLPMGAVDPVSAVLRSGARFIHPSLYPCLILLARLQPSLADTSHASEGTTDKHDSAAEAAGVVATSPHSESATGAVAPPMNLDREPLTRVNERNSTVHVTSASTMLSMYSFTELVETCIDSPVFKTREMAARAFAALVPSERAAATVVALLRSMREAGANAAANMYHGTLCQVHELLRVHWHRGGDDDGMRRAFMTQIFPALTALWPVLVQSVDRYSGSEDTFDPTDVVRHKYLVIVNEFVARGESWILPGIGDAALVRTTRLLLSRFRLTMLYGTLHPVLSSAHVLAQAGTPQTPGAFGTVLELMRLFLACVDDCAMAVLRDDGAVQLQIDGDVFDEHGANMSPVPAGDPSEVLYNPWPVLGSVLANNDFYEAKLLALEWMLDHAQNDRMDVFERMGIDNLLAYLITDSHAPVVAQNDSAELQPSRDPLVRAAAIRLLARLCTKLDIDARTLPVRDMLTYWDDIVGQLAAQFCPLSVATALVELQAALVHLLLQYPDAQDTAMINEVNRRMFVWAQQIYSWTDPERAVPYRHAVSRALITYSAIKRYIEAGSSNHLPTAPVDAPSEEIMRLCYWRLLQDDDADIREFIAHNISQRLGRELACDQACEKLVLDFRPPADSPFPATYVQNRLEYILGVSSGKSIADRVELAINPDRALFVHENPNIYIDEPRNVQLAYYSLVAIADIFAESQPQHVTEMARQSFGCVEALETAYRVLIELRKLALERGVVLGGVLGVTSLSSLFELLQSWILGARLVLFAAARLDDRNDALQMTKRVAQVADLWLTSSELQPLHPWIARALNRLCDMAAMNQEPISIDNAVSDMFLLTYA